MNLKINLKLKIILFLATLFGIALINSALIYLLDEQNTHKAEDIQKLQSQILDSNTLIKQLIETETGQRGYLLTHDTDYLLPYHNGIKDTLKTLTKIKQNLPKNSDKQALFTRVSMLINKKFAEMARTISLIDNDKREESLALVQSNEGKKVMDEINQLINQHIQHTKLRYVTVQKQYETKQTLIKTFILLMMFVFIFFAIITYLFLNRTLFQPFNTLLVTAHKTEQGVKADIADALPQDEMGYLITRLFKMNNIVVERTKNLNHKASHDPLTSLKNRSALDRELPLFLEKANHKNAFLALCFLDLNKFKPLNDTFGHAYGDDVLKMTAQILKKVTRNESIYRIGGDEFIILLENIHSRKEIEGFSQRLIAAFEADVIIQEKPLQIGISLGISLFPEDSDDPNTLLKQADKAMYQAKNNKDSSYCFASAPTTTPA